MTRRVCAIVLVAAGLPSASFTQTLYQDLVRVQGSTNIPAGSAGAGAEIFAIGDSGYLQGFNRSTNAYAPLKFYASDFSFSSGNVGIGTLSPTATLEVSGTGAKFSGILQEETHPDANLYAGVMGGTPRLIFGGSTTHEIDNASGILRFFRPGVVDMSVDAAGNVGVGTVSPKQKLSVIGGVLNVGSEGDYYGAWLSGGQATDSYLGLGEWHSRAGYIKWINASRRLAIYTTAETEPLTLQETGGNVGIGTTNPTHKLSVNGTIKAKEVIVETTGWSDYVFADDYRLAPLSEVEAHIKAKKRLPGIPSEQQVAEQGVSVGEMQAALLAKIEELTLHQIEQEKEIRRLRSEVEELRSAKP